MIHFPGVVNKFLFTEEPNENLPPTKTTTPITIPTNIIPLSTVEVSTEFISSPTSVTTSGDNPFITSLKVKTDFDKTDIGGQIKDHLIPLDGLPISDDQKMQVVLKAGSKDGLTKDKIISTLQNLISTLDSEHAKFDSAVQGMVSSEVDSRKQAIEAAAQEVKDAEAKAAAARQKQTDLSAELITAQTGIEKKKAQFQSAYDMRKSELTALSDHYNSILKGQN